MESHAWGPDSGDFVPHHVRRPRKTRHHSSLWTVAIAVVCGLMVGLSCFVLLRDTSTSSQSLPQTAVNGAAASPSLPIATNERRPRRPRQESPFQGVWRGEETGENKSPNATTGSSFGSPSLDDSKAHNPFESDRPVDPTSTIDSLVFARLTELNITPARLCSDEVFLRRIYIDTLGTLPTVEEAKRFLDDPDPEKRAKLIDQALERPEFADYWAMKWSDLLRVKAEFPIKLWPNAAQAYHRWIRRALQSNLRYDEFARELLTSSGSNFRAPQVNFYRAMQSKEPKAIAQAVALTFLGERTEGWPTERIEGMSVFFSQIGYKPTGEWKEEIVFFDRRKNKESLNGPLTAVFPNGVRTQIPAGQDPRRVFADWLVQEKNPWFARVIANRIWCWLLGRGIVDPPDDIRHDNPATNRNLLNHLASELVTSGYDLRQLYRLILNSQTYQLACIPHSENSQAAENFACYPVRRLDAEVLIDAICQITGTTESYSSIIPEPYTFLPDGQRAVTLPDGSISSSFLEMFGRPSRDTGLESERSNRLTAAQALHLLNSNHLRNKLKRGAAINDLIRGAANPEAVAESLYLAILARRPTAEERALASGLCGHEDGARDAAWALINSDEFLFRH